VQFAADPSIQLWKEHYCDSDFERCVRYQKSLQGQVVPLNLLPNGKEIAVATDDHSRGIHALFNAIQKNRLPMIKAFLKTKMSSEKVENAEGVTPLMYAASLGHYDIVKFFLENGCNPHHKNQRGETALMIAEKTQQSDCAEIIRSYMSKTKAYAEDEPEVTEKASHSTVLGRVLGFLRGSSPEIAK
jgi:hypothetical protein